MNTPARARTRRTPAILLLIAVAAFIVSAPVLTRAIDGNVCTTEADCRWCHGNTSDRHHQLDMSTYGCMDCHPVAIDPSGGYYTTLERDCFVCHGSDVTAMANRHHKLASYPSSYTNRTYECLDCHQRVLLADGTYTIGLKQTGDGAPSTEPIPNLPPVASAGPDQTTSLGQPTRFSAAGSSDPDGSIASYDWDFGDGGTAAGATVSHTYLTPGSYAVSLTVTDDKGATSTDVAVVDVSVPQRAYADRVTAIGRLKRYAEPDSAGVERDVTLGFSSGGAFPVTNAPEGYDVLSLRSGIEPSLLSKAAINLQVTGLSANLPQTVRAYAYLADGRSIDADDYVTARVISPGVAHVDVTPLLARMSGYGWMKFRIVCASKGVAVSNGSFELR